MSYHNWFHDWFKHKHRRAFTDEALIPYMGVTENLLDDIFGLLEARSYEYLENNEVYQDLYIHPNTDILISKPQIIQQVRDELREFLKLLIEHKTKSVLQIGLGHYGSTHFCLSLFCDKVVTVEYDIKNIRNYVDRELLYNQNREVFIHGDSTDLDVIANAWSEIPLDEEGYDCIFVDGNHSYEYVKADYENYISVLKPGGIFAFHDAELDAHRYGTPTLLKELEDKHDIKTILYSDEVGIACFIKE